MQLSRGATIDMSDVDLQMGQVLWLLMAAAVQLAGGRCVRARSCVSV
jgi:hypothetical protein